MDIFCKNLCSNFFKKKKKLLKMKDYQKLTSTSQIKSLINTRFNVSFKITKNLFENCSEITKLIMYYVLCRTVHLGMQYCTQPVHGNVQ